jgi:DNA-binding NtrC family response regulator
VPRGRSTRGLPGREEPVSLGEIERRTVLHALRETRGDKLAAARLLGIGKTTLYRKPKEYTATPKPTDQERKH